MRSTLTLGLIAAALAAASPAEGLAAKAEGGKAAGPAPALFVKDAKEKDGYRPATEAERHAAAPAAGHGADEKMSFIDIKRYDLGLYTLVVFGLLYLLIQTKVWPKIAEGLKAREASILGAREEAQKDRQEARAALELAKRQLDEAAERAKTLVDAAHKQAEQSAARAKEESAKAVEAAREQSRREVEAAKEAARQELYQEAVNLASMLSAKTIRRQLSAEDHRQLLDDALADLKAGVQRA